MPGPMVITPLALPRQPSPMFASKPGIVNNIVATASLQSNSASIGSATFGDTSSCGLAPQHSSSSHTTPAPVLASQHSSSSAATATVLAALRQQHGASSSTVGAGDEQQQQAQSMLESQTAVSSRRYPLP